jgi:hypothetical protein
VLGFWQISPGRFFSSSRLLGPVLGRKKSCLNEFWRKLNAAISGLFPFERVKLKKLCPKRIDFATYKGAEVRGLNGNAHINCSEAQGDEDFGNLQDGGDDRGLGNFQDGGDGEVCEEFQDGGDGGGFGDFQDGEDDEVRDDSENDDWLL